MTNAAGREFDDQRTLAQAFPEAIGLDYGIKPMCIRLIDKNGYSENTTENLRSIGDDAEETCFGRGPGRCEETVARPHSLKCGRAVFTVGPGPSSPCCVNRAGRLSSHAGLIRAPAYNNAYNQANGSVGPDSKNASTGNLALLLPGQCGSHCDTACEKRFPSQPREEDIQVTNFAHGILDFKIKTDWLKRRILKGPRRRSNSQPKIT